MKAAEEMTIRRMFLFLLQPKIGFNVGRRVSVKIPYFYVLIGITSQLFFLILLKYRY